MSNKLNGKIEGGKKLGLLILLFTFGEAALSKLIGAKVPDWFLAQFAGSLLDLGGPSLAASFWMIALLETLTSAALIASLVKSKYEEHALLLAQFTFFALMIGQRLTHKYDAAFQLFAYSFLVFLFMAVNELAAARSSKSTL